MHQKFTFVLVLLLVGMVFTHAQEVPAEDSTAQETVVTQEPTQAQTTTQAPPPKQKKPIKDKLYYGGYINLSFGSYTRIGIEPMIGYKIVPRLSVGAKIRYDYIEDKRYSETYTTSSYGASIFTRLRVIRGLYAHAEYAGYNYELYNEFGESDRQWVPFLFLGAGYNLKVGRRSSIIAQVMWDVLQNENNPYGRYEPFYSVGVGVGL